MKIEMGESIIMSWLKHAKNCQMVQLNWKPSVSAWDNHNEELVEEIIDKIQQRYRRNYDLNVFKNSSSVSQIIQQGEVDVLGMEFHKSSIENIYAVDIAFHESGLSYGSKQETVARVLKKMVRTAVTILTYFDKTEAEVIFASPKINNSVLVLLNEVIADLNEIIRKEWDLQFNFKLICNDSFQEKIFNVITILSNSVADTSELFMRSIQMYNLFVDNPSRTTISRKIKPIKPKEENIEGYEEIKIGALVRSTIKELADKDGLSLQELENLMDEKYSKQVFDINFPMLKKVDNSKSIKDQRYVGTYTRYYAFTVNFYNEDYLVTSEWFEWNKNYYIRWYEKLNLDFK